MKKRGSGRVDLAICLSLTLLLSVFFEPRDAVLAQKGQSFTKTEKSDIYGDGGKKITTETKHENGEVTVEVRTLDPKGKVRSKGTEVTKTNGETLRTTEIYDCNGTLTATSRVELYASGKYKTNQVDEYQNGLLARGFITEYESDGATVKSSKEWDPATQRYESTILEKVEPFTFPPITYACPSSAPEHKVEETSQDGVDKVNFKTPFGNIHLNLPDDLCVGDTFSGTWNSEPAGKTDAERASNLTELQKHVIEIGRQNLRLTHDSFTLKLAERLNPHDRVIRLLKRGDREVASIGIGLCENAPAAPTSFTLPTGGQHGRLLEIEGPCNGRSGGSDHVRIGETRLPIVAESPRKIIVRDTSNVVGPTKIECQENGKATECPFRNLGISLSAEKLHLLKGETTKLEVTVVGLAGINQDVPLEIVNSSPAVIDMSGGIRQHVLIQPVSVNANGSYPTSRILTGITPGSFGITATVRWRDRCRDGKP